MVPAFKGNTGEIAWKKEVSCFTYRNRSTFGYNTYWEIYAKAVILMAWKGPLAVLGSFLVYLVRPTQVLGSVYIWGNISTYVTSYLRLSDPTITQESMFAVFAIIVVAKIPVTYLGARACVRFGTQP